MRGICFFILSFLNLVSTETLSKVTGLNGHNVTLPCRYGPLTHGVQLSFCWGRGKVPTFKCSDTVLSSQDGVVQYTKSSRYQLLGRVTDGDISLTIINAQWSDDGVYGCRVEIPGWFNDYKVNTLLVMKEAPDEQPVTQDWTHATLVRHDIWGTYGPDNVHNDPTLGLVGRITAEGKFKAFLEVGNIARIGAIFLSTIIIILLFIFRRRLQQAGEHQRLTASAADHIYESVPVPV